VGVQSRADAPTVEVEISGIHRLFVLDTGSVISLIESGIYSSELSPPAYLHLLWQAKSRK
jgi:hypothetical protein